MEGPSAAPVLRLVECPSGRPAPATPATVDRLRGSGTFLWLDVASPDAPTLSLLGDLFGFHPLALEDALRFGQRPKIEDYEDHVVVIAFGVERDADQLVEVHCFLTPDALVTVHHERCAAFERLRERILRDGGHTGPMALHAVLDALTDTFEARLDVLEDAVDDVDVDPLRTDPELQSRIYGLRRSLVTLGRAVRPQRDMLGRIAGILTPVPGLDAETARYFRDVHDHLIRYEGAIDTMRELLAGATEVQLSAVSNRLNDVMKQLTAIATVFLPLTFLTGFFGQNFPWLVDHLGGPGTFAALGLALPVGLSIGLLAWFRRRGWI